LLLASAGAEVVKVEPPRGDPARAVEPLFSFVNRGKRSVVLDLRQKSSGPAREALIRWADVLVEGFRPGVMERLGCGPKRAREWNPSLIYCSVSAYGQQGPWRDLPGHDVNLQAVTGTCHLEGNAKNIPRALTLPVADLTTSMLILSSISLALTRQRETGQGCHLDLAMSDTLGSWTALWHQGADMSRPARERLGEWHRLVSPLLAPLDRLKVLALPHYGLFRTADNRWLALGIVTEPHFWRTLCDQLELRRYARWPLAARALAGPALRRLIARRFQRRTREDWLVSLQAAGLPVSPVLRPDREVSHQLEELLPLPSNLRAPLQAQAPRLGEHTNEILQDLLGPDTSASSNE
jgi:crotonobetainyl-CoA:carnitine CoA-transferase CaiB-like acyl-CoA transferase